MSQKLINLSPDLKKLRDEGYEIEVRQGHLLIHSVPYVNVDKQVLFGILVSDLTMAGDVTAKPGSHVAYFKGEFPCSQEGVPIGQIKHVTGKKSLAAGIEVDHSFSNKPNAGYVDYHHKMTQYMKIISHPAMALDSTVSSQIFKPIETTLDESVFKYVDTASGRAGIQAKYRRNWGGQRLAMVPALAGLGHTSWIM